MATVLLPTSTATLNELIGNGRIFKVPPYQRNYSWEEENWEDLWLDILGISEGEESYHYMGYIVLQSNDGRIFTIIDGQQRITTLSILALVVIKLLGDWANEGIAPEENRKRQELLRTKFTDQTDPSSLIPTSKLFLNKNNDDFYKSRLLRLRPPTNMSKLKPSERNLWKAFKYFENKVDPHFALQKDGEKLTRFLNETVANNLVFTTITVSDDLNAYKVFETLNARGVRLSTTDLLKNFLFSIAAKSGDAEFEEAERQWQDVNNKLGRSDFPTFLRYYWNSKNTFQRKQTLFKAIKLTIEEPIDVFHLLDDLQELVDIYTALSQAADDMWEKEQARWIDALTLFRVKQCYPLLLAAYRRFEPQEYTKLLRLCVVISLRYNIISELNPNVLEDAYHKVAVDVTSGRVNDAKAAFQRLTSIYVDDERFKSNFALKEISAQRNRKLVRYILFELENQLSSASYDYKEDSKATIEHILPENAPEAWEEFFPSEDQERYTQRLGNLTLLESKKNKECADKLYDQKVEVYKSSTYALTRERSIYSEWTPESLKKRQTKLADLAATVWKAPFNS